MSKGDRVTRIKLGNAFRYNIGLRQIYFILPFSKITNTTMTQYQTLWISKSICDAMWLEYTKYVIVLGK